VVGSGLMLSTCEAVAEGVSAEFDSGVVECGIVSACIRTVCIVFVVLEHFCSKRDAVPLSALSRVN
jgi:hypothetical protein